MNAKEIEAIKKLLLERKNELEHELAELNLEEISDQVQDSGDQAQSLSRESLRISLQNTEFQEYNRILKALEMIEEGTYGKCVDCQQPISDKRLKIFPNATRCLVCQEKLEEGR